MEPTTCSTTVKPRSQCHKHIVDGRPIFDGISRAATVPKALILLSENSDLARLHQFSTGTNANLPGAIYADKHLEPACPHSFAGLSQKASKCPLVRPIASQGQRGAASSATDDALGPRSASLVTPFDFGVRSSEHEDSAQQWQTVQRGRKILKPKTRKVGPDEPSRPATLPRSRAQQSPTVRYSRISPQPWTNPRRRRRRRGGRHNNAGGVALMVCSDVCTPPSHQSEVGDNTVVPSSELNHSSNDSIAEQPTTETAAQPSTASLDVPSAAVSDQVNQADSSSKQSSMSKLDGTHEGEQLSTVVDDSAHSTTQQKSPKCAQKTHSEAISSTESPRKSLSRPADTHSNNSKPGSTTAGRTRYMSIGSLFFAAPVTTSRVSNENVARADFISASTNSQTFGLENTDQTQKQIFGTWQENTATLSNRLGCKKQSSRFFNQQPESADGAQVTVVRKTSDLAKMEKTATPCARLEEEQSIAEIRERMMPLIKRGVDKAFAMNPQPKVLVFPRTWRTGTFDGFQDMKSALSKLKWSLSEGTKGLSITILPIWLDTWGSLIWTRFYTNLLSGDFAAVVDIGGLSPQRREAQQEQRGSAINSVQNQPKPFDTKDKAAISEAVGSDSTQARDDETSKQAPAPTLRDIRARMSSLPRSVRIKINLLIMGVDVDANEPFSEPNNSKPNKEPVSNADKESSTLPKREAVSMRPDEFLKMTAAEKRAFYNRLNQNRQTSTFSQFRPDAGHFVPVSVTPPTEPACVGTAMFPMDLAQFKAYCSTASDLTGKQSICLQLFPAKRTNSALASEQTQLQPNPITGSLHTIDDGFAPFYSLLGPSATMCFTGAGGLMREWEAAARKLPGSVARLHIDAKLPAGVDAAEVRMCCNRLMALTMFRTRHAQSKAVVSWNIAALP